MSYLEDEEVDMFSQVSLLNAYSIHYNRVNDTEGGFLDGVNAQSMTSTNKKIQSFQKELERYNKDPESFELGEEGEFRLITKSDCVACDSVVPLLMRLVEDKNWMKKPWKIETVEPEPEENDEK